MRIGSLFSGYGGLEQGVQAVLGGTVAWHSEIDPGACKILAHRYPGVPNLGDITAVDWSAVEPVDVLTGGFPCQDVSAAGLRRGLRPDTRSGLWTQFAYAIDQLRPGLVVIENVRGLLSADAHHPAHRDHFHPAHGSVEPCAWCVGDGPSRPLRALGAVLGELADLGYDASWQGLRASDVGAPHGRFRVFVVAWPAADTSSDRRDEGRTEPAGIVGGSDAAERGAASADATDERRQRSGSPRDRRPGSSDGDLAAAHADHHAARTGREPGDAPGSRTEPAQRRGAHPDAAELGRRTARRDDGLRTEGLVSVDWGAYGDAVRRWERCLGRPAPAPTELTARGSRRLSPAFVEWMMGLPAGWVTDVPGLGRNEQLKALGNGVVPQQAAAALRLLLPDAMGAAA